LLVGRSGTSSQRLLSQSLYLGWFLYNGFLRFLFWGCMSFFTHLYLSQVWTAPLPVSGGKSFAFSDRTPIVGKRPLPWDARVTDFSLDTTRLREWSTNQTFQTTNS
jgi:hypothetical protein